MTFRHLVLAVLATAVAAVAAQPARRAITHEDLWLMKRVGTPVASPDGKWAVFPVTQPAYDSKEQAADLWLVALDGGSAPRQLTQTKSGETGVQWAPDSSRIAFVAKRDTDEASQIYILDLVNGGEASRVTAVATGARAPKWSPDGRSLLFVSDVYPGASDDEANRKAAKAAKDRKYNARVYENFPIRHWDHWLDEKQAHLFVQEATQGATPRDLFAMTRFAAAPGYAGRSTLAGEDVPAAWTPDGKSIVFAATTNRNRAAFENVPLQLFSISTQGGEPAPLTRDADNYGEPDFSPDGRTLLVAVEPGGDGRTYHHDRIAAFPWPFDASKRKLITAGIDLSAGSFAVSADGATVYFLAEAGVQTKLFSVPITGGAVREIGFPAEGCLAGLSGGAGALVATYESAVRPPEVVRVDPNAGYRVLTRFNEAALDSLDLPKPERFTFTSSRGRSIENMLVRPAGFDPARKYPLLVVMHGGPAPQFKDAWVLRWNYHLLAAPGHVLVLTNYSGSSGYSEAFGQAVQEDPLKGPADEINEGADEAIRRFPFIDGSRQAAAGASYGGHLANWMQATTTRYRCLISHAGLVNLETQWSTSDSIYHRELNNGGPVWEQGPIWREQNPARFAGNHFNRTGWVTPMLVTVGENDFRVPANNSLETWTYLQRLQVPGKLIVFPDENHWILKGENSRFWYAEVHAWLARWLNEGVGK